MPALERSSIAIVAAKSIALAEFEKCARIAAKSRLESMTPQRRFARKAESAPCAPSSGKTDRVTEAADAPSTPESCREELVLLCDDAAPRQDGSGGSWSDKAQGLASTSPSRSCGAPQLRASAFDPRVGRPHAHFDAAGEHGAVFAFRSDDMRLAIRFLENRFGKLVGISIIREIIEVKEVAVLTQLEFERTTFQQWGSARRNRVSLARALRLAFEDSVIASVAEISPSFVS